MYSCCCLFAKSRPKSAGQNKSLESGLFFQTVRQQQQTACIAMILKHVGRSVVIFGSISKLNF